MYLNVDKNKILINEIKYYIYKNRNEDIIFIIFILFILLYLLYLFTKKSIV